MVVTAVFDTVFLLLSGSKLTRWSAFALRASARQPSRTLTRAMASLEGWPSRSSPQASEGWRRERDSNPRARFRANGFQDRRLKPLGHLSVRACMCENAPVE